MQTQARHEGCQRYLTASVSVKVKGSFVCTSFCLCQGHPYSQQDSIARQYIPHAPFIGLLTGLTLHSSCMGLGMA